MRKNLPKYGVVAGIFTILVLLAGCAQTRALNKLEELILDENEYVHNHSKSRVICCIESIDYERKHEEIINIIFNSGNLDLIDEFVDYFSGDYRNYIIRGDAYLKNAMMQQMIGVFMKSSSAASVNKAKENYKQALELNNRDIYALGVLSFLYGEEKEYDKAEELLNRGLEFAPNNPLLYLALGEMHDRKKEYTISINYYEKVLEFTEDDVKNDFEHMNQYYHKLVDYFPNSLEKARDEAKKILEKLGVKGDGKGVTATKLEVD
jgi:tetratricopeptide (TPR) repeat protein